MLATQVWSSEWEPPAPVWKAQCGCVQACSPDAVWGRGITRAWWFFIYLNSVRHRLRGNDRVRLPRASSGLGQQAHENTAPIPTKTSHRASNTCTKNQNSKSIVCICLFSVMSRNKGFVSKWTAFADWSIAWGESGGLSRHDGVCERTPWWWTNSEVKIGCWPSGIANLWGDSIGPLPFFLLLV